MGSSTSTTEQTRTLPGAGQQEQAVRAMLMRLAQSGEAQMGDLSALASGQMSVTPQDEAFIRQISTLTGELQRDQARASYDEMSQAVEGQLLERGLEGSSVEAVNQALLGRQLQQSLDMGTLQREITSAQQLQQQAQNRAGLQLNANQLLLQRILNSAGAVGNMSLQERLSQGTVTQTTEQPFDWGRAAGTVVGATAGALTGNPAAAAQGAQTGGNAMAAPPPAPILDQSGWNTPGGGYYGPSAPPMY